VRFDSPLDIGRPTGIERAVRTFNNVAITRHTVTVQVQKSVVGSGGPSYLAPLMIVHFSRQKLIHDLNYCAMSKIPLGGPKILHHAGSIWEQKVVSPF
jgi:hypothetical protein